MKLQVSQSEYDTPVIKPPFTNGFIAFCFRKLLIKPKTLYLITINILYIFIFIFIYIYSITINMNT